MKKNNQLIGVAGEYYVAAELSRRGYLAAITLRNSDGVDILVSNLDGDKTTAVQVKTTMKNFRWVLSKKIEDEIEKKKIFVFVKIFEDDTKSPEYIIVKGEILGAFIKEGHQKWLNSPGKKGQQRKDTNLREFNLKYFNRDNIMNWEDLIEEIEK